MTAISEGISLGLLLALGLAARYIHVTLGMVCTTAALIFHLHIPAPTVQWSPRRMSVPQAIGFVVATSVFLALLGRGTYHLVGVAVADPDTINLVRVAYEFTLLVLTVGVSIWQVAGLCVTTIDDETNKASAIYD